MCRVSIYVIFTFLLVACSSKDDLPATVVLSSENELLNFEIANLETEINGNKILIYTSTSALDFNFKPTYTLSEFATIKPDPLEADYTETVNFIITAENGEEKNYTTEIIKNNGLEEIKFKYEIESGFIGEHIGIIDEENKIITLHTNKESILVPSTTATVEIKTIGNLETSPSSGDSVDLDFDNLTVVNKDGTTDDYTVQILNINVGLDCIYLNILGDQTCGLRLSFNRAEFYDGLNYSDFVFQTLENDDLINKMVSFESMPIGVAIEPSLNTGIDFTEDVVFTVTSEAGNTNEFTVRVIQSKIFFRTDLQRIRNTIDNDSTFNAYYHAISKVVKVDLYNAEQDQYFPCSIINNSFIEGEETHLSFDMNEVDEANKGLEFKLRVELESGESILTKKTYIINP